jgi:hypothetical protein
MERIRDRSTGDLLVLMIAGTVCAVILIATGAVIVQKVLRPDDMDAVKAAAQIGDVINTLIGLLAGFLAGRTERTARRDR